MDIEDKIDMYVEETANAFKSAPPSRLMGHICAPPQSNWQWCFNGEWDGIVFNLHMKKPPSRLNRFMQKHLLGIHWRKI